LVRTKFQRTGKGTVALVYRKDQRESPRKPYRTRGHFAVDSVGIKQFAKPWSPRNRPKAPQLARYFGARLPCPIGLLLPLSSLARGAECAASPFCGFFGATLAGGMLCDATRRKSGVGRPRAPAPSSWA